MSKSYYENVPFWNFYNHRPDDIFAKNRIHSEQNIKALKIGYIYNPLDFEFKKVFGFIPKNSFRSHNGNIYIPI